MRAVFFSVLNKPKRSRLFLLNKSIFTYLKNKDTGDIIDMYDYKF